MRNLVLGLSSLAFWELDSLWILLELIPEVLGSSRCREAEAEGLENKEVQEVALRIGNILGANSEGVWVVYSVLPKEEGSAWQGAPW